jgi:hypothetical protein
MVTVDVATFDNSAVAPGDYVTVSIAPITFPPGVTTQVVAIPIQGDTLYENDETFFVRLANPVNAVISDSEGLGTIIDDEVLTVDYDRIAYSVDESNGPAVITVTLNTASALPVTVDFATNLIMPSPPGAAIGSDFIVTTGTLNFSPGVITQTFTVSIIDDIGAEVPETIELALSNPTVASLGTVNNPAILTITDGDTGTCTNVITTVIDIGPPDCRWILVGNSTITTDLAAAGTISITVDGNSDFDIAFYERKSPGADSEIALDRIRIEVATTAGGPWFTVFNWGDGNFDTNTNIGQAGYGGPGNEPNNAPIPMTVPPLFQSPGGGPITGITIDVDNPPGGPLPPGQYQYIQVVGLGQTEVDSIEIFPP